MRSQQQQHKAALERALQFRPGMREIAKPQQTLDGTRHRETEISSTGRQQKPKVPNMEEVQKIDEDPLPRMGVRSAAKKCPIEQNRENAETKTPQSNFREAI